MRRQNIGIQLMIPALEFFQRRILQPAPGQKNAFIRNRQQEIRTA